MKKGFLIILFTIFLSLFAFPRLARGMGCGACPANPANCPDSCVNGAACYWSGLGTCSVYLGVSKCNYGGETSPNPTCNRCQGPQFCTTPTCSSACSGWCCTGCTCSASCGAACTTTCPACTGNILNYSPTCNSTTCTCTNSGTFDCTKTAGAGTTISTVYKCAGNQSCSYTRTDIVSYTCDNAYGGCKKNETVNDVLNSCVTCPTSGCSQNFCSGSYQAMQTCDTWSCSLLTGQCTDSITYTPGDWCPDKDTTDMECHVDNCAYSVWHKHYCNGGQCLFNDIIKQEQCCGSITPVYKSWDCEGNTVFRWYTPGNYCLNGNCPPLSDQKDYGPNCDNATPKYGPNYCLPNNASGSSYHNRLYYSCIPGQLSCVQTSSSPEFIAACGTGACSAGNYIDRFCDVATGNCSSSSYCTEPCCDTYYGDTNAYCSGGACHAPVGPPDITPPTLQSRNPNSRSCSNQDVSVTVTYTDTDSGVQYTRHCWTLAASCDPGTTAASTFTNGGTITQTNTGAWTLCTKARDTAGNWSGTDCSSSGAYIIDKDIPTLQSRNPNLRDWSKLDVSVTVTYTDTGCSGVVQYTRHCWTLAASCDPGTTAASTFTNGGTITQTNTGAWTLCTKARDTAGTGNWSSTDCSNQGAYKIDKDAPDSTITSPAASSLVASNFNVSVTDLDKPNPPPNSGLDTCYYGVWDKGLLGGLGDWAVPLLTPRPTGGAGGACNVPFQITVGPGANCQTEGTDTCVVYVQARDVAGNTGGSFRAFSVNLSALNTTIKCNGQLDCPSASYPVDTEVTFQCSPPAICDKTYYCVDQTPGTPCTPNIISCP